MGSARKGIPPAFPIQVHGSARPGPGLLSSIELQRQSPLEMEDTFIVPTDGDSSPQHYASTFTEKLTLSTLRPAIASSLP